LTWPVGATAVDPTTAAALQQLSPKVRTVLELAASPLPADDIGRGALAQYAASAVALVHSLHSLVLTPAPTGSTGPAYASALAALGQVLPGVPLGLAVDGSTDPAGAVAATAGAPVAVVAFRPAPARKTGAWTTADVAQLTDAFSGARIVIDGAPAPFADQVKAASCNSAFSAVLLDRLADATKAALRGTIQAAQRGGIVCPGLNAQALPFEIQYPQALTQPVSVSLNCNRDCLYLVTLDRADGSPVVARRGELEGGPAAGMRRIALPKAKLPAGAYTVDVRLVARVNPGAVSRYVSPPLTIG
jgi:hypothetical protein